MAEARQACNASRQRELDRISLERQQREAENSNNKRVLVSSGRHSNGQHGKLWTAFVPNENTDNRIADERPGSQLRVTRRNIDIQPPELPSQNRYGIARR